MKQSIAIHTLFPDIRMMPKGLLAAFLTATTVVSLLNITINLLLIKVLHKLRKLHQISFRLILYLSISDALVGGAQLIFAIVPMILEDRKQLMIFKLCEQFIASAIEGFSINMILIIAVDRYICLKHRNRYHLIMTHRRAALLTAANAVLNILNPIGFTFASLHGIYEIFTLFFLVLSFLIFGTVIISYIRVYLSIKNQIHNLNIDNDTTKATGRRSSDKEFAKAMLTILAILAMCYLPGTIAAAIDFYMIINRRPENKAFKSTMNWLYLLPYLNSSLNAVVIIVFNKEIKRKILRYFGIGRDQGN